MTRRRNVLLSLAAILVVCFLSSAARAQGAWPGHGALGDQLLYARGYGSVGMLYSLGYVPVPPYFALHPPVYYSYPVPRPYGYSPYAYPGTVMTPEWKPAAPQEIINPYVEPDPTSTSTDGKMANRAQTIINPFVQQNGTADSDLVGIVKP